MEGPLSGATRAGLGPPQNPTVKTLENNAEQHESKTRIIGHMFKLFKTQRKVAKQQDIQQTHAIIMQCKPDS